MELTDEQKRIIEETITNEDGEFHITAVAGSGKSFTIFKAIDYIKEHQPDARILYLVFNKANKEDAKIKLSKYSTVEVKTAHSYALAKFMKAMGPPEVLCKLDKDIIYQYASASYINDVKYSKHAPFHWLHDKYVTSKLSLDAFCKDMEVHFEDDYDGIDAATDLIIFNKYGDEVYKYGIKVDNYSYVSIEHIKVFKKIIKAHEKDKKYTHSMYLKASAYMNKTGGSEYDYVFFDEAQDADYFMLKLLDKQIIHKLYFIGDERQSIYKFGGSSENVFQTRQYDKHYTLTQSFRFGNKIANLATKILRMHTDITVYGTKQDYAAKENSTTYLYRTNATLFKDALAFAHEAHKDNRKLKIDFMRPLNDSESSDEYFELMSFLKLYYSHVKPGYFYDNEKYFPETTCDSLKWFEAILSKVTFLKAYNMYYDTFNDNIHIMYNYASNEDNFVEKYIALRNCLNTEDYEEELILCTMHRSKGLQWDNVVIAEPTRLYYTDKQGNIRRNSDFMQELNLAYVAITRARKNLNAQILRDELLKESAIFYDENFILIDDEQKQGELECNQQETSIAL